MSDEVREGFPYEEGEPNAVLKTQEDVEYVQSTLQNEVNDVIRGTEREKFIEKVQKWRRQREARPEQEQKSFPWERACFPEEVDILTERGWKSIKDVRAGENVLTREPITGNVSYKPITQTYKYDNTEKLIRMTNLFFDVEVTPNHRFLVEGVKQARAVTAKEIMDGFSGQTYLKLPLNGKWDSSPAVTLWGYSPEDFLEFLGWFISEGWTYKHRCVGISQKNPKNEREIEGLLGRMGVSWKRIEGGFLVNLERSLVEHLRLLGRSWEKYIPRMYLDLPKNQLKHLWKTLVKGDGSRVWAKDKHRNHPRETYYTTSYRLAGDIQELLLKLGFSGSVQTRTPVLGGKIRGRQITGARTGYTINTRFTEKTRFRQDRSSFEFSRAPDKVYCVDVPPHHTIYVRQNGKPLWTMNSNVSVPLAMQNGNGIFALLKRSLAEREPFWTIDTDDINDAIIGEAVGKFLQALVDSEDHLNLKTQLTNILYNVGTLGTQVIKIPWVLDFWNVKRTDSAGRLKSVTKIRKNSPSVVPIRIEDFLIRPHWTDIQRAPWVAHLVHLYEHELKQRAAAGVYDEEAVEKVISFGESAVDEQTLENLKRWGIEPRADESGLYDVAECYMFYDVDGDGIEEDIIVWIHPESGTILRTDYNELGIRPFVKVNYLPRPFQFYGMGTGWICEHMQDEIDALHNMRQDGMMLSMLQMYVTRRGSGFPEGLKFRPLLNIPVDGEPAKSFMPIKFPDLSYGTLQAEMMSKQYADRASMMPDAMLGFENQALRTRNTATGTMFQANTAQSNFMAIVDSIEDDFSIMGQIIAYQLVYNRDRTREMYHLIPEKYHQALDVFLNVPIEDIPTRFRFRMKTTEAENTEMAKKQSRLTLLQLHSMYSERIMQLLPIIYNPQAQIPPEIKQHAAKLFVGATNLLEEIFRDFGEIQTNKYLPYVEHIEMMLRGIEMMKAQVVGGVNRVRTNSPAVQPGAGGGPGAGPNVGGSPMAGPGEIPPRGEG